MKALEAGKCVCVCVYICVYIHMYIFPGYTILKLPGKEYMSLNGWEIFIIQKSHMALHYEFMLLDVPPFTHCHAIC